jgi:hypothetical protein
MAPIFRVELPFFLNRQTSMSCMDSGRHSHNREFRLLSVSSIENAILRLLERSLNLTERGLEIFEEQILPACDRWVDRIRDKSPHYDRLYESNILLLTDSLDCTRLERSRRLPTPVPGPSSDLVQYELGGYSPPRGLTLNISRNQRCCAAASDDSDELLQTACRLHEVF